MKKSPALLEVSVSISLEAEDATGALLENVLGQTPSTYTDADTSATTATVYVEKQKWNDGIRKQLSSGLAAIKKSGLNVGSGKISAKPLRHEDWAESWKRHFKAIEIGHALLIKPSWIKRRPKKNQAVVILDPGLSFGTGQHATTSFCLEQLVACRQAQRKQSFLDIGTGSGILAIAAAKLGYAHIQAFDFDPESVRVSRENVMCNQVENLVRPTHQDLTKLPLKSKSQFDLVCANLIYDLLLAESSRILGRLKPDGDLILAGILASQFPKVKKHYQAAGLKLVASKTEREWLSGRFRFVS